MASFAPIRGTATDVGNTPIVDGQFLVETDQGANNRIFLDNGSSRIIVGGNADYIFVDSNEGIVAGNATTESSGADITFTDNYIVDTSKVIVYTEETDSAGVPVSGTANELKPLSYNYYKINGSTHTVTVNFASIPNGSYYKFLLQVYS